MTRLEVIRTYLEMRSPEQLQSIDPPDPPPRIERVGCCPPSFYRYLYTEVGRAWHWTDRLRWTDAEIARHVANAAISLCLLSSEAVPAGYFELHAHEEDDSVEIVHFGLLPTFIGRGWGKFLLNAAVGAAWSAGPERVWLHTCTLDHPSALPNYLKRGFVQLRQEHYWKTVGPGPGDPSSD